MTATIIDGSAIAEKVQNEVAARVAERIAADKTVPLLATVLVGNDRASASYVRAKHKACAKVGIETRGFQLSETASQKEVERLVAKLNADPEVSGILVQLPLPAHLDEHVILDLVSAEKDVDGLHPLNVGLLVMKDREPAHVACTPLGCIRLLEESGVTFDGATAVVVGRSNLVGAPMAQLLRNRNATVTVCHTGTEDLGDVCRTADILVVAAGQAELITGDMVKLDAHVIDVGINDVWVDHEADTLYVCSETGDNFVAHRADESKKGSRRKQGVLQLSTDKAWHKDVAPELPEDDRISLFRKVRMSGDVDFDSVEHIASHLTPVPGGVGPMTIAYLLVNTVNAAELFDK